MRQFLPSLTGGGSLPQSLKKDTKKEVELAGTEPATFSLRTKRSTN